MKKIILTILLLIPDTTNGTAIGLPPQKDPPETTTPGRFEGSPKQVVLGYDVHFPFGA